MQSLIKEVDFDFSPILKRVTRSNSERNKISYEDFFNNFIFALNGG